jgi:RNA polymerase sigma factor (sigma-70 family)
MDAITLESDVTLAMEGDRGAYERIVERSASTVCSIALAIVRNVEASEDVAQEVYLALWRGLRSLRNPASFLPWMRQVTRNQANEWLRTHVRERSDDSVLQAAIDPSAPADHKLIESEQRRVLAEVLDELGDEEREIVLLYYREGSSNRQVALLLGISEDAAKQRLSRARTKLREGVLERFAIFARDSAPRAAFFAAVSAVLVTGAPSVAAAATLGVGAHSAATKVSLVAGAGVLASALAGSLGVIFGLQHLQPWFDEQEESEIRRFRRDAILVILIGSIGTAIGAKLTPEPPRIGGLLPLALFFAALVRQYGVRLPQILERRMQWEQEHDPAAAAMHRKEWIAANLGQAIGALFGGLGLMFIVLRILG